MFAGAWEEDVPCGEGSYRWSPGCTQPPVATALHTLVADALSMLGVSTLRKIASKEVGKNNVSFLQHIPPQMPLRFTQLLGGSWKVISRVMSRKSMVITCYNLY